MIHFCFERPSQIFDLRVSYLKTVHQHCPGRFHSEIHRHRSQQLLRDSHHQSAVLLLEAPPALYACRDDIDISVDAQPDVRPSTPFTSNLYRRTHVNKHVRIGLRGRFNYPRRIDQKARAYSSQIHAVILLQRRNMIAVATPRVFALH